MLDEMMDEVMMMGEVMVGGRSFLPEPLHPVSSHQNLTLISRLVAGTALTPRNFQAPQPLHTTKTARDRTQCAQLMY